MDNFAIWSFKAALTDFIKMEIFPNILIGL